MKEDRKKWLIGSGVVVGAAAMTGVSYAVTKYLLKIALGRELPGKTGEVRALLVSARDQDDFIEARADAARRLEESGCEEVEIAAGDGVRLVGHWHGCADARRVIIAMHGWRSSWSNDFGLIADFWHDEHCSVLYVEQRGQNNSGGDYMGFGMIERFDCLRWIDWVNGRLECELPIYLAGMSMGAASVLMAAGLALPGNVRGIVADCGFTSPHAIWKHLVEKGLHMSYGLVGAIAEDICKRKLDLDAKGCSAVEALEHTAIPVLFIHGTEDRLVPVEMSYENYKACAASKRLFVVPGADHGMSYYVDRAGYEKQLRDFWHDFE